MKKLAAASLICSLAILGITAGPVGALGFGGTDCDGREMNWAYQSIQNGNHAQASTLDSSGNAGTMKARVKYKVYSSGVIYWSSWTSNGNLAVANALSVQALNGQHKASCNAFWGEQTRNT